MIANFVYLGVVNAPNGAAVFFKALMDNAISLKSDRIEDVRFYYENKKCDYVNLNTTNIGWKRKLRLLMQKYAHKNVLICFMALYFIALRHAKKVINSISFHNIENDQWIFNDIFSAYYFLKKKPNSQNIILILHNNGDPSRMILDEFSCFRNTKIELIIERKILWILNKCTDVVVLSELSKTVFQEKYRHILSEKTRVHVIYNGIKLFQEGQTVSMPVNENVMRGVSVGSISYRKGHDLLCEALNNLSDFAGKLEVYCIGNVQDNDIVLKNRDNELIKFVGGKSRSEISEYLNGADFFILCSRDEGMPISIIEAMEASLPIVSTNVGAIPQMIAGGEIGILVEPTVDAITMVLKDLINGKYNLKTMGEKSRKRYTDAYSLNSMLEKYNKILGV